MQEKDFIIVVRCGLKIPSLGITVRHYSANLVMPNRLTELLAYMIVVCGNYLFACGKISNMQLSRNNLSLQAI